ncbi:host attachment family protein [Hyphococcus luteus]|uniref:Host attachment protein n=1 Tax=Hyphococcus luteus TaxID=2058213 RepID=A0A2S7K2S8_9PROT|nr:host attachment family protein [Marinicaulis flavus]PQA86791.1 Host attachment protein [Marinicaulis flavus]
MRDLADQITWVVVADGEKALIFVNDDTPEQPFLNVVSKEKMENPPSREQAANRPGRFNDAGAGGAQRSAVADTDWHEFEKERFEKGFAETLNKAAKKNAFDKLVLFAPPQALGRLRKELHKEAQDRLVFTVDNDLTNHPVDEIEKHLARAYKEEFAGEDLV